MTIQKKENGPYFQAIAKAFFARRGAPFFLSSKDMEIIYTWKKQDVPLSIVLEGIEKAFENYRMNPMKKSKIQSLSFCNFQVLSAYEQHKERKVGRTKKIETREEKRKRIQAEVKKFLENIPLQINYLREIFKQAMKILSHQKFEEAELEQIEEKIEEILLQNCLPEEKNRMMNEILDKHNCKEKEELLRLFRIRMVKFLRDKYKVPYISFFYY